MLVDMVDGAILPQDLGLCVLLKELSDGGGTSDRAGTMRTALYWRWRSKRGRDPGGCDANLPFSRGWIGGCLHAHSRLGSAGPPSVRSSVACGGRRLTG